MEVKAHKWVPLRIISRNVADFGSFRNLKLRVEDLYSEGSGIKNMEIVFSMDDSKVSQQVFKDLSSSRSKHYRVVLMDSGLLGTGSDCAFNVKDLTQSIEGSGMVYHLVLDKRGSLPADARFEARITNLNLKLINDILYDLNRREPDPHLDFQEQLSLKKTARYDW